MVGTLYKVLKLYIFSNFTSKIGKFCYVGDVEEIIPGWDDLGQRSSLLIVDWQVRSEE